MYNITFFFLGLSYLVGAYPSSYPGLSNENTSLALLFQNNLNGSDNSNHLGFLLLDRVTFEEAPHACAAQGENLLSKNEINGHENDIRSSLSYLEYIGDSPISQSYWVEDAILSITNARLLLNDSSSSRGPLPVLCTQSSTSNKPTAIATSSNKILVESSGNVYVGFRNLMSFRFLGIPYANPPERFVHSSLYSPTGQIINTTEYGPSCAQPSQSGTEDCLFLNIQTPYIPQVDRPGRLRPVLFWIHGGGFVSGSSSDPWSDGGNLASKEDIVVVSCNYRLGTLGFIAIPGTNVTGNYGIGDQIIALEWTIKNIASFGGDPNKITIIGESAGAGSVRVLLGSPPAIGKFQGAVAMSNLGGGIALGLDGDYATTYSSYLTPDESYSRAGQQIIVAAGCNQSSLHDSISCLKKVDANKISDMASVARYVVQDGLFVTTPNLDLANGNGSTAHVHTIWGITANDGASFTNYPSTPVSSEVEGLQIGLGISESHAQSIIDSGLFSYHDTGNITLDSFNVSQRVQTDVEFRCIDQATVYAGVTTDTFKKSYFYQFDRTTDGYDPNKLGGPPVTAEYPFGNPKLPYFRLHGSDMPWVFGNLDKLRDVDDLHSIQLVSSYFAEFVRTGQPNPSEDYLKARGYNQVQDAVNQTGPWKPVSGEKGPIRRFDWPGYSSDFIDVDECAWLGYPISYYLQGGT